eukprot:CAMPEP_0194089602 /NCGR_PEP_ID=MMETSP0149-20130528/35244_1 /TAXON_ID=122233 /ORGANISM="Chaetoceros debilis, Strain MM31A-1" /LENGTH=48 /DNA_ID= /DNA_START= /DNA_END= /DNA_ORIENTATION=
MVMPRRMDTSKCSDVSDAFSLSIGDVKEKYELSVAIYGDTKKVANIGS